MTLTLELRNAMGREIPCDNCERRFCCSCERALTLIADDHAALHDTTLATIEWFNELDNPTGLVAYRRSNRLFIQNADHLLTDPTRGQVRMLIRLQEMSK